MSASRMAWAYEQEIAPLSKFVFVTMADGYQTIGSIARRCSMTDDEVARIVEELIAAKLAHRDLAGRLLVECDRN